MAVKCPVRCVYIVVKLRADEDKNSVYTVPSAHEGQQEETAVI